MPSLSQPDAVPVLDRLTAQMRDILDFQTVESADSPQRAADDFAGMRLDYRTGRAHWNEGGPQMLVTSDGVVDTLDSPIRVRFHRPTGAPNPAVIVYLHGGGWILGDLDTHDRVMRNLAHHTGAVVVGVDYSLAPEARFPVPIEQAVAVAEHVAAHASELGVDGTNLSFAGDSAGAHLALAATLRLAERGSAVRPRCLLLFYGVYGLIDSPGRRLLGGPWDGMSRADLEFYLSQYLATPDDARHPLFDQLAADLSPVPPCYLAATDLDPVKDDSVTLSALLTRQGTPNELTMFEGVLHGFLHYTRQLDEAVAAFEGAAAFYSRHAN
ncbi:MAG: alpha/beta hydrolase fold domain-containing protein [Promicromonosporaceae bacterium]|nr:alpha/beta hydrolase fold domain-containing protein [Promicromonosporaceae bacterium]